MLPSVRPVVRSMSSGVWTLRKRIFADVRRELGDPVDDRVAERLALVVPVPSSGARWYGAYWTKQLMTCLPGGAIDGSTRVGMIMSMYGLRLKWPYFASS